jgi:hypothetical protein
MRELWRSGVRTVKEETSWHKWTGEHARNQMVLQLPKRAVHQAREDAVLEVYDVECECESGSGCDAQEDEPGALRCEAVHYWVY